jgi:hypothetical protein
MREFAESVERVIRDSIRVKSCRTTHSFKGVTGRTFRRTMGDSRWGWYEKGGRSTLLVVSREGRVEGGGGSQQLGVGCAGRG